MSELIEKEKTEKNYLWNIELSEQERRRCREYMTRLGYMSVFRSVTYPIRLVKTLFQLGYQPYPLGPRQSRFFLDHEIYFLPNALTHCTRYANYLVNSACTHHGLKALYFGFDASILANAAFSFVSFGVSLYLDHFSPDVGGEPENWEKEENQLTNHESFRLYVRQAIRDSISYTFGVIASQPFTVIMVREMAQYIGGENKYPDVLSSFLTISLEEGYHGFFNGLAPQLISNYLMIWASSFICFGIVRYLKKLEDNADQNNENLKVASYHFKRILPYAVPIIVNAVTYPLSVISTIMAVNGSGLLVSMLPYNPEYSHWSDLYPYIRPYGMTDGATLLLKGESGCFD